jgi:hypothetical protein
MSHRKPLERRTFSQDRYEILIKRQKSGKATFNELTELDEIVNRDPTIREKVLIENLLMQNPDDLNNPDNDGEKEIIVEKSQHQSLLHRLKALISHIFNLEITVIKVKVLVSAKGNAALL